MADTGACGASMPNQQIDYDFQTHLQKHQFMSDIDIVYIIISAFSPYF
jgi:hypothetical protein